MRIESRSPILKGGGNRLRYSRRGSAGIIEIKEERILRSTWLVVEIFALWNVAAAASDGDDINMTGGIERRERLGGMLNYYYRRAA